MKNLFAILILFFLVSCASKPAKWNMEQVYEGLWRQDRYECSKGDLTDAGKAQNTYLQKNLLQTQIAFKDGKAFTETRAYMGADYSSICIILTSERWEVDESKITISGSKSEMISFAVENCKGRVDEPITRTHSYEVKGQELRLTITPREQKDFLTKKPSKSLCSQGPEIYVYRKVDTSKSIFKKLFE